MTERQLTEDELIQEVGRLHLNILVLEKELKNRDAEIEKLKQEKSNASV